MGRLSLLLLALVAAIAVGGLSTSNAAQQSAKNGCTSNTPFSGTLTTPPFSTAASASPTLAFDTWWEIESMNPDTVDLMLVEASTDGVNWAPVARMNPVSATPVAPDRPLSNIGLDLKPNWQSPLPFPLPEGFGGQPEVRVRFSFNTGDSLFNGFRGWGIDNVRVTGESVDIPLPLETFNGGAFPLDWEATGFWNVPGAPEDTAIHAGINPPLITLGTTDGSNPDFGLLPANQLSSTGYAWFGQESTATFCGENFETVLALDPFTAERTTGTSQTVNANLERVSFETAVLRWSVTGANPTSGSAAVPAGASTVPITWTGPNAGFDSLEVHLDINGNTVFDPDEILQFAEVNWTAAAAQPQQPAQQQPAQQQPTQQQPRRDPFPADVETAATLDQLSNPAPFEEINIAAEEGPIFVRLPGGRGGAARASQAGTPSGFIPLTQAAQVPVGSIVEASRGRISLESTADARGLRTQRAQFFDGMFQIRQPRSRRPVTEMVLKGGSFRGCPRAGKSSTRGADASQRRRQGRRVRRVWGNGRGNFRTRGRYSSATVRGTSWLTEDRCGGTLTRVAARPRTNRVVVQDFVTRRRRLLRAGQSYFAARPLGRR